MHFETDVPLIACCNLQGRVHGGGRAQRGQDDLQQVRKDEERGRIPAPPDRQARPALLVQDLQEQEKP